MKRNKYFKMIGAIAFFLCSINFILFPAEEKKGEITDITPSSQIPGKGFEPIRLSPTPTSEPIVTPEPSINNSDSFKSVIPQDTFVFLVGNNNYLPESGLPPLNYCYNDIELIKHLLIHCCKVPEERIYEYRDLTIEEMKIHFKFFKLALSRSCRVIIYFSGHGNKDGSLLFTDGGAMLHEELKNQINSFPQDTILILDSCYSGMNDSLNLHKQSFKSNCQRIYSTLAYQQAKEISYNDNPSFQYLKEFFRKTLDLRDIRGNGYFTLLLGQFFAEQTIDRHENISFSEMVSWMMLKHIENLEYIEMTGKENPINEEQIPKAIPSDKKLHLLDPNHRYIMLRRDISPLRLTYNHFSISSRSGVSFPVGELIGYYSWGINSAVTVNYNVKNNYSSFGIGITLGGNRYDSEEGLDNEAVIYPVMIGLDVRYYIEFNTPFFILIDLHGGGIFTDFNIDDKLYSAFYFSPSFGMGWTFSRNISLTGTVNAIMIPNYIKTEDLSLFYSPGLEFIYMFN